jgi:hypothetical protein
MHQHQRRAETARVFLSPNSTLKSVLAAEGVTVGEFIRRAIKERVARKASASHPQETANG